MGDINFYLKKAEENSGMSAIYLQFKYSDTKFVYYFGQSVKAKNWNSSKQRVKSNRATTKDGKYAINDLIDNLEKILDATYYKAIANGIPSKSVLKQALDDFINQNKATPTGPTFYNLTERFISGEIKNKAGEDKSRHTTKTYKTVMNHLVAFEKAEKYPVDFSTINLDFFRKYVNYMGKVGLAQNTRAKHIQIIKTIMNEAFDMKYTTNTEHKRDKFSLPWKEVDAIYLTDKELIKLFNYDLSDNKTLEQVRDLFVFGSFVGLRYSDYSTVKPEHIVPMESEEGKQEYFIKMITAKTGNLVIIPCNPIVLQIFEKYKHNANKLPRSISNQKFNDYIKEACQLAGLNEKARLSSDPGKELWQCISSHTARRSFATNLYLQDFPVIDLMRITGHKTESSFMKYIRHSKLDAARRLNDHMRRQWSAKLLKVA